MTHQVHNKIWVWLCPLTHFFGSILFFSSAMGEANFGLRNVLALDDPILDDSQCWPHPVQGRSVASESRAQDSLGPFLFFNKLETFMRRVDKHQPPTENPENTCIERKKLKISDFIIVLSDRLKLYFRTSIWQTKTFHGFMDVTVTKLCELTAFICVNELIFYNVFWTDAGE